MVSESMELGVVMKIPPTRRPPLRNRSYGGEGNNTNTNLKYETLYLRCIKCNFFYIKFIFPEP